MQSSGSGWGNGLLGVIIFSGSLPATRVAVGDFSALFLTSARAVIAALIGVAVLGLLRQARPARNDLVSLAIVSIGVVVGFPLLTALALQHITSAHSIVFIGLLPLSTAIFGVLRGGERPQPMFWLFAVLGSATVAGFAFSNDGSASLSGDLLMVAAIVLCGLGYAEGGALSRRLGGWQVISWALLLALAADGADRDLELAVDLERRRRARLDRARLRLGVQHVRRFHLLVSRACDRRHRPRRPVAAASAVLRTRARRLASARARRLEHDRRDRARGRLRVLRAAVCLRPPHAPPITVRVSVLLANFFSGIGLPNRKPCTQSKPSSLAATRSARLSTPSATVPAP
ncbi:hypothetical protein ACVW0I_000481 [Bradyrhizobium sp. LM6.11]